MLRERGRTGPRRSRGGPRGGHVTDSPLRAALAGARRRAWRVRGGAVSRTIPFARRETEAGRTRGLIQGPDLLSQSAGSYTAINLLLIHMQVLRQLRAICGEYIPALISRMRRLARGAPQPSAIGSRGRLVRDAFSHRQHHSSPFAPFASMASASFMSLPTRLCLCPGRQQRR